MELALLKLFLDSGAERKREGDLPELRFGFLNRHIDIGIRSVQPLNVVFQAESAVGINRKLREEKADTAEVGRRQADDLIRFFNRCLCQDVSFQITRAVDNYIVCQLAECVQEIFRFCFSELRVSVSVLAVR